MLFTRKLPSKTRKHTMSESFPRDKQSRTPPDPSNSQDQIARLRIARSDCVERNGSSLSAKATSHRRAFKGTRQNLTRHIRNSRRRANQSPADVKLGCDGSPGLDAFYCFSPLPTVPFICEPYRMGARADPDGPFFQWLGLVVTPFRRRVWKQNDAGHASSLRRFFGLSRLEISMAT